MSKSISRPTTISAQFGRRSLLKGGALLSAAFAANRLGAPFIANASAAESIKIGMVWAKTGAAVDQAEYLSQGGYLALEQQNNTILGRPAEVVWLDEPNPAGAQQNAQRLADEYKVVAMTGGALSSTALAISAVAKRARIPFVAANAAAADLTGKACNRFTFRLQATVDVQARVMAPYAANYGKKWYLLTPAYAFGQDAHDAFTAYGKENGITIVGADSVPVNTPDYTSYILKIRQAAPDVVLGNLPGNDLTTFLKQWNELGMKTKIPFAQLARETTIFGASAQRRRAASTPRPGTTTTRTTRLTTRLSLLLT